GAAGFGGGGFAAAGRGARSRSGPDSGGRAPEGPGTVGMVLYLAGAVVGVAAIVFLVVQLTNSGGGNAATGTTTPGSTTTAAGGTAAGQGYVLRQAASVGKYPLNKPAVSQISADIKTATAKITSKMASTASG